MTDKPQKKKKKSNGIDVIACIEKDAFGNDEFYIRIPCKNKCHLYELQNNLINILDV